LRATLAGAAGLLLSSCTLPGVRRSGSAPRVVVVGAGFSGLAAAQELLAAGYQVTVVEARNRVGGRVRSTQRFVPGRNVELGGELIGANHPTWAAYAERYGLEFLDVPEGEMTVVLDGRALSARETIAFWEELEPALAAIAVAAEPIDVGEPWRSPGAAALDGRTVAAWLEAFDMTARARRGLAATFTADSGVAVDRQSWLALLAAVKAGGLAQYWTQSETLRCAGGNQQLAERLAAEVGGERLRLRAPVVSITTSAAGARVGLASGATLEADDVVLAVPPSVWKRIAFTPALPATLRPQMGSNVKLMSAVRARFWEASSRPPSSMSDGLVGETWDATAGQGDGGAACLTVFAGGPAADEMRGWTPGIRDQRVLAAVEPALPGIRREVTRTVFMDWPSARWTGAGYSFPAPNEMTTIGPLWQAGIGRLHFAGEHASPGFGGYMEGALSAGVAVARRLAERDGVVGRRAAG